MHFCSLALGIFDSFFLTSFFFHTDESLQYGNLQLAVISYDDRVEYNCQDCKLGAKQVSAVKHHKSHTLVYKIHCFANFSVEGSKCYLW